MGEGEREAWWAVYDAKSIFFSGTVLLLFFLLIFLFNCEISLVNSWGPALTWDSGIVPH
jgi:hypothetical protein